MPPKFGSTQESKRGDGKGGKPTATWGASGTGDVIEQPRRAKKGGRDDDNLLSMLKHANDKVRMLACNSLSSILQPGQLTTLLSTGILDAVAVLIKDKSPAVVNAAVKTIGNILTTMPLEASQLFADSPMLTDLVETLTLVAEKTALVEGAEGGVVKIKQQPELHYYYLSLKDTISLKTRLLNVIAQFVSLSDRTAENLNSILGSTNAAAVHIALQCLDVAHDLANAQPHHIDLLFAALQFLSTLVQNPAFEDVAAELACNEAFVTTLQGLSQLCADLPVADAANANMEGISNNILSSLRERLGRLIQRGTRSRLGFAVSDVHVLKPVSSLSALSASTLVSLAKALAESIDPTDQAKRAEALTHINQLMHPALGSIKHILATSNPSSTLEKAVALVSEFTAVYHKGRKGNIPSELQPQGEVAAGAADDLDELAGESMEDEDGDFTGESELLGQSEDNGEGEGETAPEDDLPINQFWEDTAESFMFYSVQELSAIENALEALTNLHELLPAPGSQQQPTEDGEGDLEAEVKRALELSSDPIENALQTTLAEYNFTRFGESKDAETSIAGIITSLASARILPVPSDVPGAVPPSEEETAFAQRGEVYQEMSTSGGLFESYAAHASEVSSIKPDVHILLHREIPPPLIKRVGAFVDSLRRTAVRALDTIITSSPEVVFAEEPGLLVDLFKRVDHLITTAAIPQNWEGDVLTTSITKGGSLKLGNVKEAVLGDNKAKAMLTTSIPVESEFSSGSPEEMEKLVSCVFGLAHRPHVKLMHAQTWASLAAAGPDVMSKINEPGVYTQVATAQNLLSLTPSANLFTRIRELFIRAHQVTLGDRMSRDAQVMLISSMGILGAAPAAAEYATQVAAVFNQLLTHYSVPVKAATGGPDWEAISMLVDAFIDVYSEDDRHTQVYKANLFTTRLGAFASYLGSALRDAQNNLKRKSTRPTAQQLQDLAQCDDALSNLKAFVAYKKKLKL